VKISFSPTYSFERRIYFGVGLLFAAFLPLLLIGAIALREVSVRRNSTLFRDSEELVEAEQLRAALRNQLAHMPAFILSGEPRFRERMKEGEDEFRDRVGKMIATSSSDADKTSLREIDLTERRLTAVGMRALRLLDKGRNPLEVVDYINRLGRPISQDLDLMLNKYVDQQASDFDASKRRLTSATHRFIWAIAVISFLALAFVGWSLVLLVRVVRAKRQADVEQEKLFLHEMRISQVRKETVEIVAHDLKNPLSATKIRAEILMRRLAKGEVDLEACQKDLAAILRSNQTMQSLIRDLLDNAKIDSGRLSLERRDCDPASFLRDVLDRYEAIAADKGLRIVLAELPASVPSLSADPDRLLQAIGNLIGNSVKFTPKGGLITLQLSLNSRSAVFTVSDTGPGIPKDQASNIFDRYWQGSDGAKLGTGLGLAIVKAIAEAHGGHVWVQSAEGKGSDFHLQIPLHASAADFAQLDRASGNIFRVNDLVH
jgi:signal transduction histidine kinase